MAGPRPSRTTPAQIGGLAAGDHELRLVLSGCLDNRRTVKIETGKDLTVSIKLTPAGTSTAQPSMVEKKKGASDPDGDALSYSWNFGDGGSGSGSTATHVFNNGGTFSVGVSVSDGNCRPARRASR